jgi:hypothetical protein
MYGESQSLYDSHFSDDSQPYFSSWSFTDDLTNKNAGLTMKHAGFAGAFNGD